MAILYRKTVKGQAEIETRAHRLPPRMRNALIVVDGRKSDAELCALLGPPADAALQALAEQGFIESAGPQASPVPGPAPSGAAAILRAAPAPGVQPTSQRSASLPLVKRDAVRALTDAVGPMAEAIGLKIERAASEEALRPLLEIGHQIIRNTRGAGVAAEFRRRFIDPPA